MWLLVLKEPRMRTWGGSSRSEGRGWICDPQQGRTGLVLLDMVQEKEMSAMTQSVSLGDLENMLWFMEIGKRGRGRFAGKGSLLSCSVGKAAGFSCGDSQVSSHICSSKTTPRLEIHI